MPDHPSIVPAQEKSSDNVPLTVQCDELLGRVHGSLESYIVQMEERARRAVALASDVAKESRERAKECFEYIERLEREIEELEQRKRACAAEVKVLEEAAVATRERLEEELNEVRSTLSEAQRRLGKVRHEEDFFVKLRDAERVRFHEGEAEWRRCIAGMVEGFQLAVATLLAQFEERKRWTDDPCAACAQRIHSRDSAEAGGCSAQESGSLVDREQEISGPDISAKGGAERVPSLQEEDGEGAGSTLDGAVGVLWPVEKIPDLGTRSASEDGAILSAVASGGAQEPVWKGEERQRQKTGHVAQPLQVDLCLTAAHSTSEACTASVLGHPSGDANRTVDGRCPGGCGGGPPNSVCVSPKDLRLHVREEGPSSAAPSQVPTTVQRISGADLHGRPTDGSAEKPAGTSIPSTTLCETHTALTFPERTVIQSISCTSEAIAIVSTPRT